MANVPPYLWSIFWEPSHLVHKNLFRRPTLAGTFGVLSLVFFVLSASIHALTFAPGISISIHFLLPLHAATLVSAAAMGFVVQSIRKKNPKQSSSLKPWLRTLKPKTFPMIILCIASFVYAADNFSRCMDMMKGGAPTQKDGKYYLENHGRKIREINKAEYDRFRAIEFRLASGHWMAFTLLPATFFFFIHPGMRLTDEGNGEKAEERL